MAEEIKHRGDFMKSLVDRYDYNHTKLAEELRVQRGTIYNWFKKEDLDLTRCKQIADVLNVDLREYIPAIAPFYGREVDIENETYKEKYYELLEKYSRLNEKIMVLMEAQSEYKTSKRPGQ